MRQYLFLTCLIIKVNFSLASISCDGLGVYEEKKGKNGLFSSLNTLL